MLFYRSLSISTYIVGYLSNNTWNTSIYGVKSIWTSLLSHRWCLGTISPLASMFALCGRHGMSLERCLVRNMPQREQRWRVASV